MQTHPGTSPYIDEARPAGASATRPQLDEAMALAEAASAMIAALRRQDWPEGLWPDVDELAETWEDLAGYLRTLSASQVHPA